jgi:hypothetical protein
MGRIVAALIGLAMLGLAIQHAAYAPPEPARQGLPNIDYPTGPWLGETSPPARQPGEAELAYALRLSRYVHESSYHCRASELPLSWIERGFAALARPVFAEGLLVRERFRCGLCSQRAGMLDQLLHERGIASDVLGVEGHVVVKVGDHIVDPDFNVGPFLYSDPDLYRSAAAVYSRIRGTAGFDYAAFLASKGDNELYDRPYMEKMEGYQRTLFRLADVAALLLAAVGLGLILLVAVPRLRRTRRSARL